MLPYVKIDFSNGALGRFSPSSDCCVGLICTALAVPDGLELCKPYILYRASGLADLGVTSSESDENAFLYKHVSEFYDQAGDGAELWLYAVSQSVSPSEALDPNGNYATDFIRKANGRLRCLAVAIKTSTNATTSAPSETSTDAPTETSTETPVETVLGDVMATAQKAQSLALWATNSLYAPIFVVIEAYGFNNNDIVDMPDLTTYSYNRVGILVGDTVPNSDGAAIGVLAGRIAACPVQRHIGRVKDGALNVLNAYIGDLEVSAADTETLSNKGYITFRTYTGKSGYFFNDDTLATSENDDYRSIAHRRTIDKAYRICYATMLEHVNDEIPVTNTGELVPSMAKSWESEIISDIVNQMTANGELGTDPNDSDDKGVNCYIDYAQNVLANSRIDVVVQVKPYGYARYIEVKLGFVTTTTL